MKKIFGIILILFVVFASLGLMGLIIHDSVIISQDLAVIKNLVDDLYDEENFGFFFVDREALELRGEFVSRVLGIAERIEIYDVTFTKSSAIIKSIKINVVTKRRPPIEWLRDSSGNIVGALVWYWKGVVHYPEDIEDFIKQRIKDTGGKKKKKK